MAIWLQKTEYQISHQYFPSIYEILNITSVYPTGALFVSWQQLFAFWLSQHHRVTQDRYWGINPTTSNSCNSHNKLLLLLHRTHQLFSRVRASLLIWRKKREHFKYSPSHSFPLLGTDMCDSFSIWCIFSSWQLWARNCCPPQKVSSFLSLFVALTANFLWTCRHQQGIGKLP